MRNLKIQKTRVKRPHICLIRVSGEESKVGATMWNLNFVLRVITNYWKFLSRALSRVVMENDVYSLLKRVWLRGERG